MIKLTDKEVKFLKDIHNTEVGNDFVDYVEHVKNYICDVRNFEKGDTAESVRKAADILQLLIIDKIKLQNKLRPTTKNEME